MNALQAAGSRVVGISRQPIGKIYRAAWLEYAKPLALQGAMIAGLLWLASFAYSGAYLWAFYTFLALTLVTALIMVYLLLYAHSIRLYADRQGVWFRRGVFQWEVQITVVRWDQVGEAVCNGGAVAWLTGAYNIAVTDRRSKGAEIWCKAIADGPYFVGHINSLAKRLGNHPNIES